MKSESDVALVLINVIFGTFETNEWNKEQKQEYNGKQSLQKRYKKGTYKLSIGAPDDGNSKRLSFDEKKRQSHF